jgi:hypothetical protein
VSGSGPRTSTRGSTGKKTSATPNPRASPLNLWPGEVQVDGGALHQLSRHSDGNDLDVRALIPRCSAALRTRPRSTLFGGKRGEQGRAAQINAELRHFTANVPAVPQPRERRRSPSSRLSRFRAPRIIRFR